MSAIVGIALAGGLGVRARPITLGSPGQVRSKATIRLLGRPLIEWQIDTLHEQGINDFRVVAKGQENRRQIADVLGHGERHGVFLENLKENDRIITTSGIYGQIARINGDKVQLQIADKVRIDVSKAAIGGYQGQPPVVESPNP